jgi:hypothetical protein
MSANWQPIHDLDHQIDGDCPYCQRTCEALDFYEAWRGVETALPEGWFGPFELLTKRDWPVAERWSARAYKGHGAAGAEGTGPTPTAALNALREAS